MSIKFDKKIIKKGVVDMENLLHLPLEKEISDKESLAAAITPLIEQLLNRDFEKLLQLCYRLDLGEKKLNQILTESPPEKIKLDLSMAIVERQLLKVYYREKYRASQP